MQLRILAAAAFSVFWVASAYADVCNSTDSRLLRPDLVAEAPAKVRVLTRGRRQQLTFTATIGNVGNGPLILTGQSVSNSNGNGVRVWQQIQRSNGTTCAHDVGFFPFDGEDDAGFRLNNFVEYQLRQDDPFTGPIVARFPKTTTCLLNIVALRGAVRPLEDFDCADGPKGISVGFADQEDGLAPGQSLNLDADPDHPVPPGDYFLVIVVNPSGAILESHSAPEDAGVASVTIGRASHIVQRPRPTRRPRPPRTGDTPIPIPSTPIPSTPIPSTPGTTPQPPPPSTPTPTSARPTRPTRPPIALPPGHEGCGGNKNKVCSPGEFCQYPENRCSLVGDTGICTPMSVSCTPEVAPVCGCNGVTYQNDCLRQRGGTSRAHQGPC